MWSRVVALRPSSAAVAWRFAAAASVAVGTQLSSTAVAAQALSPKDFTALQLVRREKVTHDTDRFVFGFPEAAQNDVSGVTTASCVITRATLAGADKPITRPYTPVSDNAQKGSLELLVKTYPQGNMSRHIHGLKVGDSLEFKGPFPKLPYVANKWRRIGMVAGGTGIAPMWQVIREILNNPADKTEIVLLYANKTDDDIILRAELDALQAQHRNFKVVYVLEQPKTAQSKKWPTGFVTADLLKAHMPAPSEENKILVCGPPGMMNAISGDKAKDFTQGPLVGHLAALGYTSDHVYKF